jgi:hypothetical protein
MPTTLVHRLELMRLLYRFKGLVEWELAKLAALDGDTVPLELAEPAAFTGKKLERKPPSIAPGTPGATGAPVVPETPPIPGAGASDGSLADLSRPAGAPSHPLQQTKVPTNLESCCRSADLPTGGYVELVDAATPYVRALAEE